MLTWTGPGGSRESPCTALLAAWQFDGASGGFPAAQAAISNTDVAQWGTDWASRHRSVQLLPSSLTFFTPCTATTLFLSFFLTNTVIQHMEMPVIYMYIHTILIHTKLVCTQKFSAICSKTYNELGFFLFLKKILWWALQTLFTEPQPTHRVKEETREGGIEEEAGGGRVRGLAGHSHNEKNLAAAHCVLVMRSMCRRGALLLISGGSQAFHARLVIGPEGAFIQGDSNCERASGGVCRGGKRGEREKASSPSPPLFYLLSPSAMIKHYCRQRTELQTSVQWKQLELDWDAAGSSGGHEGFTSFSNPCCLNRI